MSISNGNGYGQVNGFGDMLSDIKAQETAAYDRRMEPADPIEYMKWARQVLRTNNELHSALLKDNANLTEAGELATVGLNRLGNIIRSDNRIKYETLLDLHRDFMFKNQDISYTLEACANNLKDTTMTIQLVSETLVSPLADRHKKAAVQKELGLRLRDIDASFSKCKDAIDSQKTTYKQLSEGLQKLLHEASVQLPPDLKEDMHKEDQVAKIALMHKKSLEKGKDAINYTPYKPDKDLKGWGDTAAPTQTDSASSITKKPLDIKFALASTTVGIIIGVLLFYVILPR